ncbi:uncharacterized protein BDZ99DRAFT_526016 [Mytilinidion resinicola]|uniref:Amidase domain-containing protein n=1 Tax=Mytilinidion resinicola TaxID=574789 RepID=A0A6A6Y7M0_9PEZI|nr:uncharacterized protein BDZ99DRAFT_526016 [Mytilinidion resinicola]KAF2803974.1 hypothetical protein BDZ99DRAFT_526016 [Mytilinidion resinicola]
MQASIRAIKKVLAPSIEPELPSHSILAFYGEKRVAKQLDDERANRRARSPFHGIPIILEDNIMTDMSLGMDTTVGSYAFVGAILKKNTTIVDRLQKKGMIILGKSNMTEFCGLKTPLMPPGW